MLRPNWKGHDFECDRTSEFNIYILVLVGKDEKSVLGLSVSGQHLSGQLALKDQRGTGMDEALL